MTLTLKELERLNTAIESNAALAIQKYKATGDTAILDTYKAAVSKLRDIAFDLKALTHPGGEEALRDSIDRARVQLKYA